MNERSSHPKYVLRFFFDAGSGICFWSANEAAKLRFDYPVEVERLPLSASTQTAVNELLRLYDESFDWKNPAGPAPWTADQQKQFNLKVMETLKTAIKELGPDFEVIDGFSPRLK
jgi:hypothetical protein